jgi:hypothetical protein
VPHRREGLWLYLDYFHWDVADKGLIADFRGDVSVRGSMADFRGDVSVRAILANFLGGVSLRDILANFHGDVSGSWRRNKAVSWFFLHIVRRDKGFCK